MGPLLDAPWAPVFLAVLWFMHPWLGIFAVSMAIVLLIVMVVGDLATRRKTREGDSHQARAHGAVDGVLRSGELVHEIGRAHVCTPVTHAHIVCRLLLETKTQNV